MAEAELKKYKIVRGLHQDKYGTHSPTDNPITQSDQDLVKRFPGKFVYVDPPKKEENKPEPKPTPVVEKAPEPVSSPSPPASPVEEVPQPELDRMSLGALREFAADEEIDISGVDGRSKIQILQAIKEAIQEG